MGSAEGAAAGASVTFTEGNDTRKGGRPGGRGWGSEAPRFQLLPPPPPSSEADGRLKFLRRVLGLLGLSGGLHNFRPSLLHSPCFCDLPLLDILSSTVYTPPPLNLVPHSALVLPLPFF